MMQHQHQPLKQRQPSQDEIKKTLADLLCLQLCAEQLDSEIEWKGSKCKVRDIPDLRFYKKTSYDGEEIFHIKIPCNIIIPKERYTATRDKLYLLSGQMRGSFSINNCYDSLIFPRIHDLEHLVTEEERLQEMQRIMDKQKNLDVKALMKDHGYNRDEIIEEDDLDCELELLPNGNYKIKDSL